MRGGHWRHKVIPGINVIMTNHLCRLPNENNATETSEQTSDDAREASLCAHYHTVSKLSLVLFFPLTRSLLSSEIKFQPQSQLLTEISAAVMSPAAPLQLHRHKPSSEFHNLLPTLDVWAQQLHLLKVNDDRLSRRWRIGNTDMKRL